MALTEGYAKSAKNGSTNSPAALDFNTADPPGDPARRGDGVLARARRFLRAAVGSALVAGSVALVGCGSPSPCPLGDQNHTTAVVVIHRQGELAPQLAGSDLAMMRCDALNPEGADAQVYVVAAGRDANEIIDMVPRRPNGQREHGPRQDALVDERLALLQPAVDRAAREASSVDILRALDAASRTGAHRLIVLTGGLSWTDPLDLRISGWDRDPAALAAELRAAEVLPTLSGREVTFSGLGRTTAPQPPLGAREQARLRALWMALCTEAGATCDINDAARPASSSVSELPAEVIPIPALITTPGPRGEEVVGVPAPLLFLPDSCVVPDRSAAAEVLAPIAAGLRAGGATVAISGRTAPVGPGTGVELGLCRANAAADLLLTELHVPASAITAIRGDGSLLDPPEASRDAAGRLDPAKLAALRRVVFTITRTQEVPSR